MIPKIVVWGLSHKTAPVEFREQLEVSPEKTRPLLAALREKGGISEAAVLSTCNRVEVYFSSPGNPDAIVKLAEKFLARAKGINARLLKTMSYRLADGEAVRHLFRVAGGLESMVLGEPQILGQVKEAYLGARQGRTIGPFFSEVFEKALHAGKRIRSETQIGERPVSVSFMAVALARKIFGDLRGRTVLVMGAGQTGQETLVHLQTQGAGRILVANRTWKKAQKAAAESGGEALRFEDVSSRLDEADIVISSTGSDKPILPAETVRAAAAARKGKPLLLVDIAVPRDIEAEAGRLENVYLYNIDDLKTLVEESMAERRKELPRAEAIVEEESMAFFRKAESAGMTPVIVDLQRWVGDIKKHEIEKTAKRMGWGPEERAAAEALVSSVTAKILHEPMVRLKAEAGTPEGGEGARWLKKLFGLK